MDTCEKLNSGRPLDKEAFYVDHQHRVKSGEPCMAAYAYNLEVMLSECSHYDVRLQLEECRLQGVQKLAVNANVSG